MKPTDREETTDVAIENVPKTLQQDGLESLPDDHRNYLLERHGTLDLDPLPTMDPADPFNWPYWKKKTNILVVAFLAFMGTFTATSIIPAYMSISTDLGVSVQSASYLTSAHIVLVGVGPLIWKPLSQRYGRRPMFIGSVACALACHVGCAKSFSYGAMMACRVLGAFFISPAMGVGGVVVTETFFAHERIRNLGIWTLALTIGVAVGPLAFGPVIQHMGYRWVFWILAALNGLQLVLILVLGPETLYLGDPSLPKRSAFRAQYLSLTRQDPRPLMVSEIIHPLQLFMSIPILIASTGYAMVFLFANILCSVEIPSLLQVKFDLTAEQLGFQFSGIIIGSLLGEFLVGPISALWQKYDTKRLGRTPGPESRLWLSYPSYIVSCVGIVVFLVCVDKSSGAQWTVAPVMGTAIAAFGNQVIGTVLTTYAIDTRPEDAASVGVSVNIFRSLLGFTGPFWFQSVFDKVGIATRSAIFTVLIIGVGLLPTMLLHIFSRHRNDRSGEA